MKSGAATVLVFFLVCGAVVCAIYLASGASGTSGTAQDSKDAEVRRPTAAAAPISPADPDAARVVAALAEPTNSDTAVSVLNGEAEKLASAANGQKQDVSLEQKYAGATYAQLHGAKAILAERRDFERDRISKELIAANRLTEVAPSPSDGLVHVMSGNLDGSPVSTVWTFEPVDGVSVSKAATISGEEFPEYRALELEVWWLECKVHKLKKENPRVMMED
ncbi:MAG: hypothetical protein ABI054_04030 [Planctomycetota bacterium]